MNWKKEAVVCLSIIIEYVYIYILHFIIRSFVVVTKKKTELLKYVELIIR